MKKFVCLGKHTTRRHLLRFFQKILHVRQNMEEASQTVPKASNSWTSWANVSTCGPNWWSVTIISEGKLGRVLSPAPCQFSRCWPCVILLPTSQHCAAVADGVGEWEEACLRRESCQTAVCVYPWGPDRSSRLDNSVRFRERSIVNFTFLSLIAHTRARTHARTHAHTHTHARTERERQTDRQTDRDRDRDRQTDGQTETDRQTDRQRQRNRDKDRDREEQTLTMAVDLEDACNRVHFKLLVELLVQYGVSLTLTRWLAATLQERKVAMRLGNWISTPHQLTMGLPQGFPLSPVLYNVYTGGSEQQWYKLGAYAHGRWAYLQNSQWHPHNSHRCPGAAGKSVILVPKSIQARRNLFQWRSQRTHEQSQIPRDSLRQNADVKDAGRINKTQVQERTACVESHGFKRHRTKSSVPAVSECDTRHHWLWSGSHNPVTVKPAEARQGAGRSHESHSGNNKGHTHWGYALPTGPAIHGNNKVEQVKAYLNAMQNPKESTPWCCCQRRKGV